MNYTHCSRSDGQGLSEALTEELFITMENVGIVTGRTIQLNNIGRS